MVMDINSIPTEALEQEQKKRQLIKAVMPIQDFQNRMREVHPEISDDAINGIPQGLNNGYNDIAEYINLAKIRTPQGQEQIDLARQGQFNLPEQDQTQQPAQQSKIAEIMSQIGAGYDDNTKNSIALSNFAKDPNKTGWNRLGEAIGTGQRILSNPALQGLIAGAAYGKYRGDALEGLKYGFDWAQNKAKSDYYAKQLQGDSYRPRVLGGYGADDLKAATDAQYKQIKAAIDQQRYEAYAKDIASKIDIRDKEYQRKVEEFAKKYGLEVKKLDASIRHQKAMEGIGYQRNQIAKENGKLRADRLATNDRYNHLSTMINVLGKKDVLSEDEQNLLNTYMSEYQDLLDSEGWEIE